MKLVITHSKKSILKTKRNWRESCQYNHFKSMFTVDNSDDCSHTVIGQSIKDKILEKPLGDEMSGCEATQSAHDDYHDAKKESIEVAARNIQKNITPCHRKRDYSEEKRKYDEAYPKIALFQRKQHIFYVISTHNKKNTDHCYNYGRVDGDRQTAVVFS